jgi:hypothetical protein
MHSPLIERVEPHNNCISLIADQSRKRLQSSFTQDKKVIEIKKKFR